MSTLGDASADESALLKLARDGDEAAFGELAAPYRAELRAYCYRMLGSVHDAEDALQDALLRAWRGLPGFEGRGSVRSWLCSITTNAALDITRRSSRRELPVGFGPAAPAGSDLGAPLTGSTWLEPYPDRWLAEQPGPSPEARYELRESVELAFVVALQELPPQQRSVLLLREVLGFSAAEIASQLCTSVPGVNSSLQRARATIARGLPRRSQQATLRTLGDEVTRELVRRYADAIEAGDVDTLISMLTHDATWSMPPVPTWYAGHEAIQGFLRRAPLSVRWRHLPTRANGQLAVACYLYDAGSASYRPGVLDVLTLRGGKIASVIGFMQPFAHSPGLSSRKSEAEVFASCGLPARLG